MAISRVTQERTAIINQDLNFQIVLAMEIMRGNERMPEPVAALLDD
jgi:hypothetical protein